MVIVGAVLGVVGNKRVTSPYILYTSNLPGICPRANHHLNIWESRTKNAISTQLPTAKPQLMAWVNTLVYFFFFRLRKWVLRLNLVGKYTCGPIAAMENAAIYIAKDNLKYMCCK